MSLFPLEQNLAESWPPADWRDLTVLVAVSGGSDSVALLRALLALKRQFGGVGGLAVAHFNHRLRGAESDGDQQFVVELCREIGVPCEVGQGASKRQADVLSGESAARNARYAFLQATAERLGARYVATAHTADDQAETILHRILRGTGLGGLAGMSRARPLGPAVTLIRPLLTARRSEILAYLEALGQTAREDSSNRDSRFTRNRLRHELLPLLARNYNPAVTDALLRLGSLAAEAQEVIADRVAQLRDRAVRSQCGGIMVIDCQAVASERPYLVRELLITVWRERHWPEQSMGLCEWNLLAEMVCNPLAVSRMFPGGVTAERRQGNLTLGVSSEL